MKIKINSFKPLCSTELGLRAIKNYNFPPFIDGSCRREPDFQNPFPSITALCRQGKYAPYLKKSDIVVYMTVGGRFQPFKKGHHLVAILQVVSDYQTHNLGQIAYSTKGLKTPSNCMVLNNPPYNFDETSGDFKNNAQIKKFLSRTTQQQLQIGRARIKVWDNSYLNKSLVWPCFVKTKPLYLEVNEPILLTRANFNNIFGKLPNTQTPKLISEDQLLEIGKLIGIDLGVYFKK